MFTAIEIEINHDCNLSCSYCPNSVVQRMERGRMDRGLFENILDQLVELKFSGRMSFDFYNEPFLHPQFVEFVELALSRLPALSVEIYTNGLLVSPEALNRLFCAGIKKLIVTEHEGIKKHPLKGTQDGRIEFRNYSEIQLTNRGGVLPHLAMPEQVVALQETPCGIPSHIVTVTVGGSVLACFEDFHQKLEMGNLRDSRLIDIWNSQKYVRFRKSLAMGRRNDYEPCRSCSRREAKVLG